MSIWNGDLITPQAVYRWFLRQPNIQDSGLRRLQPTISRAVVPWYPEPYDAFDAIFRSLQPLASANLDRYSLATFLNPFFIKHLHANIHCSRIRVAESFDETCHLDGAGRIRWFLQHLLPRHEMPSPGIWRTTTISLTFDELSTGDSSTGVVRKHRPPPDNERLHGFCYKSESVPASCHVRKRLGPGTEGLACAAS